MRFRQIAAVSNSSASAACHACGVVALNLGRGPVGETPRLIKLRGVVGLADSPTRGRCVA